MGLCGVPGPRPQELTRQAEDAPGPAPEEAAEDSDSTEEPQEGEARGGATGAKPGESEGARFVHFLQAIGVDTTNAGADAAPRAPGRGT